MIIKFEQIQKSYGKLSVLKGLNLQFDSAGIHTILGPNGSGKTTLIKILLGMVIPQSGKVLIDKSEILNKWSYRDQIDYLPQSPSFPDNLTVSELIEMISKLRSKPNRAVELIKLFEVDSFLDQKLVNLSGGTRQKVNLILAFMFDSPLIILDEPTSGLDPVSVVKLKDLLRRERLRGKMIIVTTHMMSFVEAMADEIVFLLDGLVYFKGGVQELQTQHAAKSIEIAIANLLEANHA